MIAWAAESAQYFVAQGFALAMLAWMQTLPEFAVEAVLAWHQQTHLLLANLTGALRLLTGLGWPAIYLTAAFSHRRATGRPLRLNRAEEHHSVEVMALLMPLLYIPVIAIKGSLTVYDGAVLIVIYAAYYGFFRKLPSEDHETIEDLEIIPRTIVTARRSLASSPSERCSSAEARSFTSVPSRSWRVCWRWPRSRGFRPSSSCNGSPRWSASFPKCCRRFTGPAAPSAPPWP